MNGMNELKKVTILLLSQIFKIVKISE